MLVARAVRLVSVCFFFFSWREGRGGRTPDDPLDHVRHDDRGVFAHARREQRGAGARVRDAGAGEGVERELAEVVGRVVGCEGGVVDEVQRGGGVEVGGEGLVVGVRAPGGVGGVEEGGGAEEGFAQAVGRGVGGCGCEGGRAVVWVRGGGFEGEGGRGVVVFHRALVVDGSSCVVEESRLLERQVKKMEKGTKVRWKDACHVDAADYMAARIFKQSGLHPTTTFLTRYQIDLFFTSSTSVSGTKSSRRPV